MNKLAQIKLFDGDGLYGFGPLGLEGKLVDEAPSIFSTFISSAIGLMTLIAIIWFVFIFLTGAIGVITAGSDKQAIEAARKRIFNGLIGLVITIFAILIIGFIGSIFGLSGILNFGELFSRLQIQ